MLNFSINSFIYFFYLIIKIYFKIIAIHFQIINLTVLNNEALVDR